MKDQQQEIASNAYTISQALLQALEEHDQADLSRVNGALHSLNVEHEAIDHAHVEYTERSRRLHLVLKNNR